MVFKFVITNRMEGVFCCSNMFEHELFDVFLLLQLVLFATLSQKNGELDGPIPVLIHTNG